jgi:hypothetical protein
MPAFLVTLPTNARFTLPNGATDIVIFAADSADALATAQSRVDGGDSDAAWAAATATEITAETDFSSTDWAFKVAILDSTPVVDLTANGGITGVDSVVINSGGNATYVVAEVLTVLGGTATRAATIRITSVDTGVIDGIELVDPGEYTVAPSLTANAVTGGSGDSATMDLTVSTDEYVNFLAEMVGLLNAESIIAAAAMDLGTAGSTDLLLTIAAISDALGDRQVQLSFERNGVAIPGLVSTIVDEGVEAAVLTMAIPAVADRVPSKIVAALK